MLGHITSWTHNLNHMRNPSERPLILQSEINVAIVPRTLVHSTYSSLSSLLFFPPAVRVNLRLAFVIAFRLHRSMYTSLRKEFEEEEIQDPKKIEALRMGISLRFDRQFPDKHYNTIFSAATNNLVA